MTKRVAAFCAALISFVVFLIIVLWGATFGIDGSIKGALNPGSTMPINVRISNPHFYPLYVRNLTVRIASITTAHKGETCRVSNYTLTQPKHFSERLAPFSSIAMQAITSKTSEWPSLHLIGDLSKIDNGCQGATINLAYSASGSWWKK
jgi:hypothetical protein